MKSELDCYKVGENPVGWSPWKAVKKVARGVAKGARGVARGAKAVRKGAGFIAKKSPAFYAAKKLVKAARGGNHSARMRLVKMKAAANQGQPAAVQALAVTQEAAAEPEDSTDDGDDDSHIDDDSGYEDEDVDGSVSGWLYGKGYRNNVQAGELDRKNPLHVLRGLYNSGNNRSASLTGAIDLGKSALDFFTSGGKTK